MNKRILKQSLIGSKITGTMIAALLIVPLTPAVPNAQGVPGPKQEKSAVAPPASTTLRSFAQTLPGSVVKLDMIVIPGGNIVIAGKKLTVKPFWMANTETTWEAFDAFTASGTPSPAYDQTKYPVDAIARPSKSYILPDLGWGHHGYPVINVSILSATMFCRWLSAQTGKKYRLPTEAQWEYACRAGNDKPTKLNSPELDKQAWYGDNSDKKSHPVGKKLPNAWKLYDMVGNVGEWAMDADNKPVLCGGTFLDKAEQVTPLARQRQTPEWQATDPQLPKSRWWLADGKFVGFRVVCEP